MVDNPPPPTPPPTPPPAPAAAAFAGADLREGFAATVPLALGVASYGVAMGVVAATKPITLAELLVKDTVVVAGAAQIVAVGLWSSPIPVAAILLSTFVVNLRYVLLCASLRPVFDGRPLWQKLAAIHLVADENWAVTMARHRVRPTPPGHLLGGGLAVLVFWLAGSAAGYLAGHQLPSPSRLGLDFAFTAAFVALTVGFWRGRGDLLCWVVAAVAALLAWRLLPGPAYIVVGALSGAAVAARGSSEAGDGPP